MNRTAVIIAAACICASPAALAQNYPNQPIRIVSQFRAGSGGDSLLRVFGEALSKVAGRPVVAENKPGGGGMTATVHVANSAEPDGYTLLGATPGPIVTHRFLTKKNPLDPLKVLKPISRVGEVLITFGVNPKRVPVQSFKEFLDYVKQHPRKVSYGTSGIGSPHHLSGEELKQILGVQMIHVPYKSTSRALLDCVGGQLDSTFTLYAVAIPHIESGKFKILAARSDKRAKQLPDVPTVTEIVPEFQNPPGWTGLFVPIKTPDAIVKRLNSLVVKALASPEIDKKLGRTGFEATPDTPEQFAALIDKQIKLVDSIVKKAGIKPR
ncbi:MAG: hypothetical protein A3G25_02355 [Betaproteobacteria bacterium RIFCSPLOWO2_12_FULL_63_13]|nr:MAG: hypothetical protein A3H32_07850 [Betaproteobacteria bacterium RIFCSPLOWO2_02_FULL_63_19]OGA42679.1 MAG: hypothetical protein A3G25_02355 [Betaproteobacteria bacterium RIFCSPLOWO2_12_FULL_63_13]